jgi:hypothetical protein
MHPEWIRHYAFTFLSIDYVLQNLKQSLSGLLGFGSFFIISQLVRK